jgi:urea carboxylase
MGTLRVVDPGFLTTIQDPRGRPGLGRFGIPVGGAADRAAARLANRLVGAPEGAPLLELTVAGPTLVVDVPAHVALTGADLGLRTALAPLRPGHSVRLPAGTTIRSGTRRHGARAYLAIEGGFRVPPILGSPSTDRRSRLGGIDGRELRAGDVLELGAGGARPVRSVVGTAARVGADRAEPIRVVAAPPALEWFGAAALDLLVDTAWTVADDADRHGLRLLGGRIPPRETGIASVGVPLGAIQVPASGEPIVTMVDGPVTGGYPILGVVAGADHGRLAQLVPGDPGRFALVSVAEARALAIEEPAVEVDLGDLAAGWAGSTG